MDLIENYRLFLRFVVSRVWRVLTANVTGATNTFSIMKDSSSDLWKILKWTVIVSMAISNIRCSGRQRENTKTLFQWSEQQQLSQ